MLLADEALGEAMTVTLSSPAFVEAERTESATSLQVVYVTADIAVGGDERVDVDVDVVDVVGNRAQRRVQLAAGDLVYDDLAVVPNIDGGLRLQRAPDLGDSSAVEVNAGAVAEAGRIIVIGAEGEDVGHLDVGPAEAGSIVMQGDRIRPNVIFVDSAGNETPPLPLTRATLSTSIANAAVGAYVGAFDRIENPVFDRPNRVADVDVDVGIGVAVADAGAFSLREMPRNSDDVDVQGGSLDTFMNREVFVRFAGGITGPPSVQVVALGSDGLRVLREDPFPAIGGRIIYDPRRRSVVGITEFAQFSCPTATSAFRVFNTTGPLTNYCPIVPGAQSNVGLMADSDSGLVMGGGTTRNFGDVGQCQSFSAPRLRFDQSGAFEPHPGIIATGVVNPHTGRTVALQNNGTVEFRDGVAVVIDPTVTAQTGAQLFVDAATNAVLMAGYRADNSPVARMLQGLRWQELDGLPAVTSRPVMRASRRIMRRQSTLEVDGVAFMFDGSAMVPLVRSPPLETLHQASGITVNVHPPSIVGIPGGAMLVEARASPSFAHVFLDGAFVPVEMPPELADRTAVALAHRQAVDGDDEVLAFGGFDGIVHNDVWAFSLDERTWRQLTIGDTFDEETGDVIPSGALAPPATTSFAFVQAPDGAMLARASNETWRFNADDTWTLVGDADDVLPPALQHVALVTTSADVFLFFSVAGVTGVARFDDDDAAWVVVNLGDDISDVVGGVVGDPVSGVVRFAARDALGVLRSVELDADGPRLGGISEALPENSVVDLDAGEAVSFLFSTEDPESVEAVTTIRFPREGGAVGMFLPLQDAAITHRGAVEALRVAVIADGDATVDVWSSTATFEPLGVQDGEAAVATSNAVAASVYDHAGAYVRVAGDATVFDGRLEVDYLIE